VIRSATRFLERWSWAPWARHLAVFATGFAVLILRRPETLTRAEFWNEDGQVFYVGSFFGSPLEQLTRSYAGYLHAVPRLVAWLERLVDVSIAPLVGNAIALLIVAGIATWIASERLANILPSRAARLALAALLLLMPGHWESLGSITLVQFYLGIFLILASLADAAPRPRWAQAAELAALALAGLSGPFSVLFLPLYLGRAWLRRDRWATTTAAFVGACAVLQLVAIALGTRSPEIPTIAGAAALLLARGWATVIGDWWLRAAIQAQPGISLVLVATAALAAAALAAATRLSTRIRLTIAYAAAASVAAALTGDVATFPESSFLGSRYFLIPTFLVALGLVAWAGSRPTTTPSGARSRDFAGLAGIAITGLYMFGIVGDFSLPGHETHDWAVRSQCIGGPAPCDVPVEFPNAWTIHWPGSAGPYVQPQPHHAEAAQP
jgi:Ca2+/Na+ antiporter